MKSIEFFDVIEYLTNGIGPDESTAVQKAQSGWPLTHLLTEQSDRHAVGKR